MRFRPRARTLAAAGLACLALAPAAQAAKGDGPYTPFPEDPGNRAATFVNKLNHARSGGGARSEGAQGARQLTPEQLAKGVVLKPREGKAGSRTGATAPAARRARQRARAQAASGTPFDRAGFAEAASPPNPSAMPFVLIAAALAAGGAGIAVRNRRQSSSG